MPQYEDACYSVGRPMLGCCLGPQVVYRMLEVEWQMPFGTTRQGQVPEDVDVEAGFAGVWDLVDNFEMMSIDPQVGVKITRRPNGTIDGPTRQITFFRTDDPNRTLLGTEYRFVPRRSVVPVDYPYFRITRGLILFSEPLSYCLVKTMGTGREDFNNTRVLDGCLRNYAPRLIYDMLPVRSFDGWDGSVTGHFRQVRRTGPPPVLFSSDYFNSPCCQEPEV